MSFEFPCTKGWIALDLPHQIWEAQSADGHVSPLIVRFFHNKLYFLTTNYLRCYLSYLSPEFILATFTVLGLFFYLLGTWYLLNSKRRWILVVTLLGPIFPLLQFPSSPVYQGIILYTCLGVVIVAGMFSSGIYLAKVCSRFFRPK